MHTINKNNKVSNVLYTSKLLKLQPITDKYPTNRLGPLEYNQLAVQV
jgi:hypothetical protein